MKYLEWNNIIAGHFFNKRNAGKDIHLYLTKLDIINLATSYFNKETEENIWSDFIKAIKIGLPGSSGNIIAKTKYCYDKRYLTRIDSIEIKFPLWISYLIFLVLPLIEDVDGKYGAYNYYNRLNRFLQNNQINETIGTNDLRSNEINLIWRDLENWSNIQNNGDLGIFKFRPFINKNWIYVGKFFSQCVFPPKAIKRLPELFLEAGMIPDSTYGDEEIKRKLLQFGSSILHLSNHTLDVIRKSDSNELGQSIIEIVTREYNKWTGETNENEDEEMTQCIKKNYTIVPLFLQLKVNENDGLISFSFRAYSQNDYPEDLKFRQYENLYEINGWSKTLNFKFKESFELKDDFNKWIARFPYRDVRLFISAGNYQLSTSYWIETKSLSKTEPMYILCRNSKLLSILVWGESFRKGNFRKESIDGLPDDYSLFKILNPVTSNPEVPILTLYTEKKMELIEGLKINFRTFINDFLPEVEILNSDGNEKVFLQYKNQEEKISLLKKQADSNHWLLPSDTLLNVDFYIEVEGEQFIDNDIAYNLTSSDNSANLISEGELPSRDSFGRPLKIKTDCYCLGSNIVNPMKSSQRFYSPWASFFISNIDYQPEEINSPVFFNHAGNMLSSYLSSKRVLSTEEFYKAFEFYFSKEFDERDLSPNFNLTRTKRSALNFYDYIGLLDYDYENKKIVINPPQLIFIPSAKGKKVLLIGGRDKSLIKEMIVKANKYDLEIKIKKQFPSNEFLLLPDIITIDSFSNQRNGAWETNLMEFSKEEKIKFSRDYFPQIALTEFSANIEEYEKSLELIDENDYGWARKIFNPSSLRYEQDENKNFDRSFSLNEYKLNEYTYYNKLWKDGKCFSVDKNWGRYLALKYYKKNVIMFDGRRKRVAIPIETPLPRLLAESMMLLSGFAPEFLKMDEKYYRVFENIPGIFTENLFYKLGQRPINKELR